MTDTHCSNCTAPDNKVTYQQTLQLLNTVFGAGLGWGVFGAGLASTLSQWVSGVLLVALLFKKQLLRLPDLLQPPTKDELMPYAQKGVVLTLRMIITYGKWDDRLLMCV